MTRRFPNIGAVALAILAIVALVATAAMVITADRSGGVSQDGQDITADMGGEVSQDGQDITADMGGEVSQDGQDSEIPAPAAPAIPMPAATASVVHDAHIGETPDSDIDMHVLTEAQADEVKSVLNSDERLKRVLSGESFTVTMMGPWINGGELVGALAMIELDNPVSYTGSLPRVGIPSKPKSGGDYRTGEVEAQAQGIEFLEMLVDLDKRIVASIRIEKATGEVHLDYGDPGPIMRQVYVLLFYLRMLLIGE